jgi:hypothetical protein
MSTTTNVVDAKDLMPVRSRVSWGAILAGAVIALAVYFLLGALGVALGISLSDQVEPNRLGMGAGIWAMVTCLVALFIGGWVASQCTVGENKGEAAMYGVLTWGVVSASLLVLALQGVSAGYSTFMDVTRHPAVAQNMNANNLNDQTLMSAGFTQEEITNYRAKFDKLRTNPREAGEEARAAISDPRTKSAAWWTFGGILISVFAAIFGALVGAGPEYVLSGLRLRTTSTTVTTPR